MGPPRKSVGHELRMYHCSSSLFPVGHESILLASEPQVGGMIVVSIGLEMAYTRLAGGRATARGCEVKMLFDHCRENKRT